jgi:cysteine-rich repeat protein
MQKRFLSKSFLVFSAILMAATGATASAGQKNKNLSAPVAETIIIDGCDSGIANQPLDGVTMNDLIANCAANAANHGAFVSCVAHLTNLWKQAGLINGQAKGAIQRCAAGANIPPSDLKCTSDADCDDGIYCNGAETCLDKECRPGAPVECPDDGLFCNGLESCDEAGDSCVSSGNPCAPSTVCYEDTDICGCGGDADCDDGLFCNGPESCLSGACQPGTPVACPDNGIFCDGAEYCDENGDACASTGDPCAAPYSCDEPGDSCMLIECGNGMLEPGEQCDDGNVLDGDCCDAACQCEPAGSLCSDGVYCNGEETCDGAGMCLAGTPVDCNDGITCTSDACDETSDACIHDPDNASCDDALYCNGAELCDTLAGCQPGTPVACPDNGAFCDGAEYCDENGDTCASTGDPCAAGDVCNEESDTCNPVVTCQCGDGAQCGDEQCDDGNLIDGDCCSAACILDAAGNPCPDDMYCNGAEACDGAGTCLAGIPVDCNDGVACTADSCNEATDSCDRIPDDAACDDAMFCNGMETCDLSLGCLPGTPVDCPDNGAFCDGTEYCDETGDTCISGGDPCASGERCNEESDACDPVVVCQCGDGALCGDEQCDDGNMISGDCCDNCVFADAGSPCSDEVYCNGAETCDGAGICQPGTPVECTDGVACTEDSCNETSDTCEHIPSNAACDDGLYCNGAELCDQGLGCQPGAAVECPDNGAFCDGTEYCDEESDSCISSGDPCADSAVCDEEADACTGAFASSLKRMFLIWQQGR